MKIKKEGVPFTMVANEVLSNERLSLKAKGMYAYLFSKPDGWDFSGHRIIEETKEGRSAVFAAMRELIKEGYLNKKKLPTGKVEYSLKHSLVSEIDTRAELSPDVENRYKRKPLVAKTDTISNKEDPSNKEEKVIINTSDEKSHDIRLNKEVQEIINSFSLINEDYKSYFANKTQRNSTKELLSRHSYIQIERFIVLAKFSFNNQYFPNFISPHEMKIKWAKLEKFYNSKQINDKQYIEQFNRYYDKYLQSKKDESEIIKDSKKIEATIGGKRVVYELNTK